MVVKCTKCGHQQIVDRPVYSSPIVQCEACGKNFYEEKFREAALFPPPLYEEERNIWVWIYFATVVLAVTTWIDLISAVLLGAIFALEEGVRAVRREEKNKTIIAARNMALSESRTRLRSKKYQQLLIECSDPNKRIAEKLEKYNRELGFILVGDEYVPRWQ